MIPWEIAIRDLLRLLNHTQETKEAQLKLLGCPETKTIRRMWYEIYKDSVFNRVFEKIESLPVETKTELWDFTRQIAPNLDIEEKIKVSKGLYAIEYYLNNPL